MAITKNLVVTLKDDIVELKDKMFIFRNDVGVEMIIELKDFEYSIDAIGNKNNFSRVSAIFRTPSGKLYSYNDIKVSNGKIRFVFTQDLINVMQEIGEYELQFQLYDKLNNRLTIPSYNFYVKEPLSLPNEAIVGEGRVGFSYVAEDETYLFSIENGYIKTEWEVGDLITKEKLNKIENAIFDAVNVINNMDITNNNPNLGNQHAHNNMGILNTITADKINQWDNKSDFDGNYNNLINKPPIPTEISDLINDVGYLTSIPSEYVTDSELNSKGYLTEHQDISGKVDKVNGKSLISDDEIERLSTLKNYDDTEVHELIDETNASLEQSVKFKIVGEGSTVPPISGGGNYDDTEIRELINEVNTSLEQSVKFEIVGEGTTVPSLKDYDDTDFPSDIINLKQLGVEEGVDFAENNTLILENLIKQYPKGEKTFFIPKGTYNFNPINLNGVEGVIIVKLKGESDGLSLGWSKNISTIIKTNRQDFIYDKRTNTQGITFYVDDMKFYSDDGYNKIPSGVCFGAEVDTGVEYNFHFNNVYIHNFDYGFKSPGFSCGGSGGKFIGLSCCHYGIYINRASHLLDIENIELTYNRVGIRLSYGGNPCTIKNVHVATGYLGGDKDTFEEFIVFHTKGQTTIDSVYQEAYEGTAQPEKTTVFHFEGWGFGCGGLLIKNTPIAVPSGAGGKWLKARTFLGAGYETGASNPIQVFNDIGNYPDLPVKLENCMLGSYRNNISSLLSIIDCYQGTQNIRWDIDLGIDIYEENNIICNRYIAEMSSVKKYPGVANTEKTYDGVKYICFPAAGYRETYKGFSYSDIIPHIYVNKKLNVYGEMVVVGELTDKQTNIDYGMLLEYKIGDESKSTFYSFGNINGNVKIGDTFPFLLAIKPPYNSTNHSITFATKILDEANNSDGLVAYDCEKIKINATLEYDKY